jgi:ribosome-associated toxin RatA of RatAB toxin-antitoxin module
VYGSGRIDIPVAPVRVYEAVTDYAHLPEYVTAMDSCTVLGRDSLGVVVQQMGMIKVIVRRPLRMTLRFKEEPPARLWFEIVAGDFSVYYGVWEFEPSNNGTLLKYTVTMRPPAFVPTWLVRPSIERTLCRTLVETRREAERREALAAGAGATEPGTAR